MKYSCKMNKTKNYNGNKPKYIIEYYNYKDENGLYLYRRYKGNNNHQPYNTVTDYDEDKELDIASCKEYSNCLSKCTTTSGTTTSGTTTSGTTTSIKNCKINCKTSLNGKGIGIDMCSPGGDDVIEFYPEISENNKKRMPFVINTDSENYKRRDEKKILKEDDDHLLFLYMSNKIKFIKDITNICLEKDCKSKDCKSKDCKSKDCKSKDCESKDCKSKYCETNYFKRNVKIHQIKNKINIPTVLCIVYVCIILIFLIILLYNHLKKDSKTFIYIVDIFNWFHIIILFAINIKISHHITKIRHSSKVKEYYNNVNNNNNNNNNINDNGTLVIEDYNIRKVPKWWAGKEHTILNWINGNEDIAIKPSIFERPHVLMVCGWIFFTLFIIITILRIWLNDKNFMIEFLIFCNFLHLIFFTVCYWKAYNTLKDNNKEYDTLKDNNKEYEGLLYLDNEHYNLGIYSKCFRIIYLIYTILYPFAIVIIIYKYNKEDFKSGSDSDFVFQRDLNPTES